MEKIKIGLEWFRNPDHLPLILGIHQGWFQEEQLEVEMVEPEEHFDAIEEIKAGTMDIAITEPLHLVEDRGNGEDVIGFTRFLHTNGGVMFEKGKGIERPRDLIGKRIQYPGAPGPGGLAIVKTMVEADGGECSFEDFQPINNNFYHTEALEKDLADAATVAIQNFEIVEARIRGLDVDYFALKDWNVPDFCQLILTTSREIFEKRKHAFQRFIKVLRQAIDFIKENPEQATEIYLEFTKEDKNDPLVNETIRATIPCFTYDFSMSTDYYDQLQKWLHETGIIKETIDPAEYWTNECSL